MVTLEVVMQLPGTYILITVNVSDADILLQDCITI